MVNGDDPLTPNYPWLSTTYCFKDRLGRSGGTSSSSISEDAISLSELSLANNSDSGWIHDVPAGAKGSPSSDSVDSLGLGLPLPFVLGLLIGCSITGACPTPSEQG